MGILTVSSRYKQVTVLGQLDDQTGMFLTSEVWKTFGSVYHAALYRQHVPVVESGYTEYDS